MVEEEGSSQPADTEQGMELTGLETSKREDTAEEEGVGEVVVEEHNMMADTGVRRKEHSLPHMDSLGKKAHTNYTAIC